MSDASPPWSDSDPVFVVTGATRGIGRAAADALCSAGARVVLAARDMERASSVCDELRAAHGRKCAWAVHCDLASFDSVRQAAEEICRAHPAIDGVIANAGITSPKRVLSVDGNELTFQVNHLSHFLLLNLLRPALIAGAPARVVIVSSDAHFAAWDGIRFDDLTYERGYAPFGAYAHSKLANIMCAFEAAERWLGTGVSVNAMHPGPVATDLGMEDLGLIGWWWKTFVPKLTPEQGADTIAWLALDPQTDGVSGRYYYRRRARVPGRPAREHADRRRLWNVSARLTGLEDPDHARL